MTRDASLRVRRKALVLLLLVLALLALTASWSATPLRAWLDVPTAVQALRHYGALAGPLVAVLAFAAAAALGVPVTFLTLVTIVAFGPVRGVALSLIAAAMAGSISYGIGRLLGREAVDRLAGAAIAQLNQRLKDRGLLAVALIRLVPVAPFAVVNMTIGVSHISFRQFIIGSTLGMLPGACIMALFIEQIVRAFENPGTTGTLVVVLMTALIVIGLVGVTRWVRRRDRSTEQPPELSE